jgi:hypothetical protein
MIRERSWAVFFFQAGQAASAASIAWSVFFRPKEGTEPTNAPVAGLWTAILFSSSEETQFPLIKQQLLSKSLFFKIIETTPTYQKKYNFLNFNPHDHNVWLKKHVLFAGKKKNL